MNLHIVNKSPGQSSALQDCLAHCTEGDSILLIEDGVYAGVNGERSCELLAAHNGKVLALESDVSARGLDSLLHGDISRVDYPGFVELCVEHKHCLSWF